MGNSIFDIKEKSYNTFTFWESPIGWAPESVVNKLSAARLDWLRDLTDCLDIWGKKAYYKARQICIEQYGCFCSVCGFDFAKLYGEEFEGKNNVHHLKALSEVNEEYEVDPINELLPVCPNYYLASHSKVGDKPYAIEELKEKTTELNL